jgi:hypothetical protein
VNSFRFNSRVFQQNPPEAGRSIYSHDWTHTGLRSTKDRGGITDLIRPRRGFIFGG